MKAIQPGDALVRVYAEAYERGISDHPRGKLVLAVP